MHLLDFPEGISPRYIVIEYTVKQQHHQQFTTFGLLFKPSSDHALLRIKEKDDGLNTGRNYSAFGKSLCT
jgi:hypothetical protein